MNAGEDARCDLVSYHHRGDVGLQTYRLLSEEGEKLLACQNVLSFLELRLPRVPGTISPAGGDGRGLVLDSRGVENLFV